VIRATYEIEPAGAAEIVALRPTAGRARSPGPVADSGLGAEDAPGGRVAAVAEGRAVIEFPDANWGADVALLLSALLGEAAELAAVTRCRLVDLEVPAGLLPGPALGAGEGTAIGVIVKPALGLSPGEVADVAATATAAGATLVKDDELLGDPPWCPLDERVRAVAKVLPEGVTYCANVTGPTATLVDRARRAVDLGATGVMVTLAQGLDAVLALRRADLGVPVLAHRAGAGGWCRNERFGATGAVLCGLARLCGADHVIVGAFGGALFDSDEEVAANLAAARRPLAGVRPSWALLGGGVGPDDAAAQADRAGRTGVVVVLGSRAYAHPGGLGTGVRAAARAVGG
jgi:ribulose 1,5-bisphosphate carboxylase large subunit-like protein